MIPDCIYLQLYDPDGAPSAADAVTHSATRVYPTDVEYRRSDGVAWRALCLALIAALDTEAGTAWTVMNRIRAALKATEVAQ